MSNKSEVEGVEPELPNHSSETLQRTNKNEEHALLQEINNNISCMRTLVSKEGEQQPVNDILSKLKSFNTEIKKQCEKLQQQLNASTNQTASEGRLKLSELDRMIVHDPVMKIFEVSYDNLQHSHLKFCLPFLAIFPENVVLRKRPLIYWWIGEGLIPTEEKGEEIFEELLKLELIIPSGNGKNPLVSKCRIHPWIRFLLIFLAKGSGLLSIDDGVPRFDITSSRRTCLVTDDEYLSLSANESKNNLRTIFNVNQNYVSLNYVFFGSKDGIKDHREKLAVLMLGRWQDRPKHHIEVENEKLLQELRTLKHLKYLSLRGISRITELPDIIVNLINLEILDLKACHNLEKLPADFSPLKKLTHLDVSECYLLESMPKGLDKLTSLQVLKGFVIGNSKKTPCRISDLAKLEKLKRFSIHIGSEAVVQEGEFLTLSKVRSVTRLKISWGTQKEQIVKESFSFPSNLDKLDFEGFPYEQLPKWLEPSKLKKLKKLYIKGGKLESLELNHQGGDEWQVEILRLHYLKNLPILLKSLKNLFPSLKYAQVISTGKKSEEELFP